MNTTDCVRMLAVEWPISRAPIRLLTEAESDTFEDDVPLFPELQQQKQKVGSVRATVGERRWNVVVNDSKYRCTDEICSRAYFKLQEIFKSCVLKFPTRSVHLCESPGGFIQATGDFVKQSQQEWSWWAISLPPTDQAPSFSKKLPVDAGSIMLANIFDNVEVVVSDADLVTADGAVDADHDRLETSHLDLLVAQLRVALLCLAPNGTFVCKFFEGAHHNTRRWIALCTTLFDSTSIIKPNASRPTNSERYLVARGRTADPPLSFDVRRLSVSQQWMTQLESVLATMAASQQAALTKAFLMLDQS